MKEDIVEQPYCVGDVVALLSKFSDVFSGVRPGSVIVLRISESSGGIFTLKRTSEGFKVDAGNSQDADIVLDIDRPVFERMRTAKDISRILREAMGSGQARAELKADYLTLYRKGYLDAAQKLGLA